MGHPGCCGGGGRGRRAVALALLGLCALAAALGAGTAAAQEAPALEDPRAQRFKDVERGFFVGFEAGYAQIQETRTADAGKFPATGEGGTARGAHVGLNVGVDLGSRIGLSLFAQGGNLSAAKSYGAFALYAGGADVRIAVLGRRDRNGWERLFLYVHGRGGYVVTRPEGLFGTTDVLVQGGIGLDYYARLRHFSLGLAADYVHLLDAGTGGFAVYPTVRYTF
jgi:hypothetical protein